MKIIPFRSILLLILFGNTTLYGQSAPIAFDVLPNGLVSVHGDLADGRPMPDLSWAWSSQNACFVPTRQVNFSGHHVLYRTDIPPRSEMTIRIIPRDKNANFSIYAYSGSGDAIVPNLPSCVSCEADYKWEFKRRGKTQDHTRSVQLRAVNNPYVVIIGVVGAEGLDTGAFTLEVSLEGGEPPTKNEQAPLPVRILSVQKGNSQTYRAQLNEGEFVYALDWAWSSQNACFPSTQQTNFQGHHQLYVTELPERSELTITLVPDDPSVPLNLYAYSMGREIELVPKLNGCVSCEASYLPRRGLPVHHRSVQLRAINNPYRVVIGVAGANGVTSGSYRLQLDLE